MIAVVGGAVAALAPHDAAGCRRRRRDGAGRAQGQPALAGPRDGLVVFCGLADTAAFASYVAAANHGGIAVPAVLSSQFAAVSVLIGVLAMGERLSRFQLGGVVSILRGIALVTAVQS